MASHEIRRSTAPHLAQRDLVYATPERTDEFLAAVVRGFHDDYVADRWLPMHKVFEPERSFGFQVGGRWISTCAAYSRRLTVPGERCRSPPSPLSRCNRPTAAEACLPR